MTKMKFNPKKMTHKLNPMFYAYNEYVGIPSKKKAILRDNNLSLNMKVLEYNKLKLREEELKKKLGWIPK